jgi:hypothetical protein
MRMQHMHMRVLLVCVLNCTIWHMCIPRRQMHLGWCGRVVAFMLQQPM